MVKVFATVESDNITADNIIEKLMNHIIKTKKYSDTQRQNYGDNFINCTNENGDTIFQQKIEFPSECKMKLSVQTPSGSNKNLFPTLTTVKDSCGDPEYAYKIMKSNIDFIYKVDGKIGKKDFSTI